MPKNLEMHAGANYCLTPPDVTIDDGVLRSASFDDVYFSVDNGLAETRHVFLGGNDLPARMAAASHLTIAETGFGTGLNLLAVMQEMAKCPNLHIDYLSVEAHPLTAEQMQLVHDKFPELAAHAAELRASTPPPWPGHHVALLMDGRLTLHLLYGDAEHVLSQSDFRADAWFLDGFTPACNPQIWSTAVLQQIGRLTAPMGSFATFSAAAAVRSGMADAGFTVLKQPGHGRKRDMIAGIKEKSAPQLGTKPHPKLHPTSHLTSHPKSHPKSLRIGIIGGGIGGASVAAGLQRRGALPVILEGANRLATGASGNRLALQTPRLAVDHNAASRMSAICLGFAAKAADDAGASRAHRGGHRGGHGGNHGVISFDWPEREAVRHTKFRAQSWPKSLITPVMPDDPELLGGIGEIGETLPAMFYDYGRVIDPAALVNALASNAEIHTGFHVASILHNDDGKITVEASDGRSELFDAVVLALGANMDEFLHKSGIEGVKLDTTSGQVSHVPETPASAQIKHGLSFGGYLTPSIDGIHELGATFDRSGDIEISVDGHHHNLGLLPEPLRGLFDAHDPAGFAGRVSQRASTPDRNPIMGRLAVNIYALGALGARGFTLAPLLGDMLAADILGRPNSLENEIKLLLDPFRFRKRDEF